MFSLNICKSDALLFRPCAFVNNGIKLSFLMFFRYIIFATHMENLSELAPIYPNVKILHFHVDIRNNRLDFKVGYLFYFLFILDEIQVGYQNLL